MFSKFFEGKCTEHLLGEGITAAQINDDRLGNVLDDLHDLHKVGLIPFHGIPDTYRRAINPLLNQMCKVVKIEITESSEELQTLLRQQ